MKCLFTVWLFLLPAMLAVAQWSNDPSVNTLVRNGPDYDYLIGAVPDGIGGAIYVIQNSPDSVFAQRISKDGLLQWGPSNSGKRIILIPSGDDVDEVVVIPDGSGGAIIGWVIYPASSFYSSIYLQRFSAEGNALWSSGGIQVASASDAYNLSLAISADSAGGVYAGWTKSDGETYVIVMMQRISGAGVKQWGTNGTVVCQASGFQAMGGLGTDPSGNAVVFFQDYRNDPVELTGDIYGQRMSPSGDRMWGGDGLPVCVASGDQYVLPNLLPDGSGGMITFFEDYRNDIIVNGASSNTDIYSQRVDANGNRLWGASGKPVHTVAGMQYPEAAVSLGGGFAAVTWTDGPSWQENMTYGQCLDGSGNLQWMPTGLLLTGTATLARDHSITSDAAGNLLVAFTRVDATTWDSDIRMQKINRLGVMQWAGDGVAVCNRADANTFEPMIVPADGNSAIVAWIDNRNRATTLDDIYAAKVNSDGKLASASITVTSIGPGNWNDPAIWSGGIVPGNDAEVVIRHSIVVTADAQCKSVKLESPSGSLRVSQGIKFTVLH